MCRKQWRPGGRAASQARTHPPYAHVRHRIPLFLIAVIRTDLNTVRPPRLTTNDKESPFPHDERSVNSALRKARAEATPGADQLLRPSLLQRRGVSWEAGFAARKS
jgi:hypothetical protein